MKELTDAAINWPSLLVSAGVGGLSGYLSARIQEVQKNRRKLRALAGALAEDAKRIRAELGEPTDRYVESYIHGTVPAAVAVHPWTEKLITDAAEISPALVGEYMTLERALQNFNTFREQLRETLSALASFEEGGRQAERDGVGSVTAVVLARRRVKELQEIATAKNELVASIRKQALAALDEIARLLAPYLKSKARH